MFFYCLAALLVLAPLYKAGNRPVPLLLLELAAIAFLLVIVAVHRAPLTLPRAMSWALGLLLVYPLVQLMPVPAWLWRWIPGHATYAAVLDRFAAAESGGVWRSISVIPTATEYGWLALLPPLACLLAAMRLSVDHVARLMLVLVAFAGAESFLGLLQVAPGGGGKLYFGNEEPGQYVAIGTFVNRNHLAAMLAMVLPVIVGLLVYSLRPGRRRRQRPLANVASEDMARRVILFACAVLILLGLFFTRSRAGIATGMVALMCSGIVLVRARAASVGSTRTRVASYIVIALVAITVILALFIGIGPILRGFESRALASGGDFRWSIYYATIEAAIEFLPFGSGLSTFAGVFQRFQIGDVGGYIDYAHNDYLQAFMELGVVGVAIIALLLAAWVLRMNELLHAEGGRSFTLLQIGAGLGLLPIILHSVFDFALHMPADAMWAATLAGVMFHKGVGPRERFEGELRKPRREELVIPVVHFDDIAQLPSSRVARLDEAPPPPVKTIDPR